MIALILYGVYGMRQGFVKEMVSIISFFLAFALTSMAYEPVGSLLGEKTGLPGIIAYPVAGMAVWVILYFVLSFSGRLLWKLLRRTPTEVAEDAAEQLADEVGDDTDHGPITIITNRILPQRRRVLYWLDKILGGFLGLVKGFVAVAVSLFAIQHILAGGWLESQVSGTGAYSFYKKAIDPIMQTIPEFRIAARVRDLEALATDATKRPELVPRFLDHPKIRDLSKHPAAQELMADDAIVKAFKEKDYLTLLRSSKVQAVIKDASFRQALADVDWKEIHKDIQKEPEKKPAPPASTEPAKTSGEPTPGTPAPTGDTKSPAGGSTSPKPPGSGG